MRPQELRRFAGICAICFGAGVALTFLLPGALLAFLEAVAVVAAGLLLLPRQR